MSGGNLELSVLRGALAELNKQREACDAGIAESAREEDRYRARRLHLQRMTIGMNADAEHLEHEIDKAEQVERLRQQEQRVSMIQKVTGSSNVRG